MYMIKHRKFIKTNLKSFRFYGRNCENDLFRQVISPFPTSLPKKITIFFQTGKKVSAKFLPKNFEKLKSLRARGATVERKCGPFPVMWALKKFLSMSS